MLPTGMNAQVRTDFCTLVALIISGFLSPVVAQEVFIPDPGLNAAVRDTLHKPAGPLTQEDLLTLTNLNASRRNVRSVDGLEAARNLVSLDLQINRLTNFSLPGGLTKLTALDVSVNPLANFFLPNGLTNLTTLTLESAELTNLTLPADLTRLNSLDLFGNRFTSFTALSNLTSLVFLDLSFNSFTNFSFPRGLTNLTTFLIKGNSLTNITLPGDLTALNDLFLDQNQLGSFTVPAGLTNLLVLNLFFNQLTNLDLPSDLRNLLALDLDFNRFTSLDLPSNLARLSALHLRANLITSFILPAELTGLSYLDISANPLTNITLPAGLSRLTTLRLSENKLTNLALPVGMTNLVGLNLTENQLTNLVLPPDLHRLESLDVGGNQLISLALPAGLTNLVGLFFVGNQLTTVTLPPDMTQLIALGFLANPLTTFVLPETLAATNLAGDVASLRNQGVSVFTYPLAAELVRPRMFTGRFQFGITGPPGVYAIFGSTDLAAWSAIGTANNVLGSILFNDVSTNLPPQKFYRALLQSPPTNMVFISPNTFTMGSPTNDFDRNINEGPQTSVTLTHGFWIARSEVTQGEYLSVMGTNPSEFPGDLSRPVSSVTWLDATNYCAKLTERELASGRISPGSLYRLPTEAEWECAARAGTSTRFSYGDDPQYLSLTNYAWFLDFAILDLTVHSVGQKRPNSWGLYDMYGNVWEWCQDNYGTLPGGVQIDWSGPPSSLLRDKVMRGGAYDYPNSSCRSASRAFRFPLWPDSDVGFRVVLQTTPANMVFVPPNTFTMGSPTNELHRDVNEGPRTTVTLSLGFWIGKYEVTQEEYLSVTGTNPSQFPGDLSRPVSSVSWPDATNYCAKLTERELAAGRIPVGSRYRLPTEAEWECAARAGTTTRFSYGDDPDYISLPNYAWQSLDDGLTVHPVGQKLPNPWGLYDMAGNVFEWCQDWLGPLPGGFVTDPQGPPSNPIGWKIMRGGAFDVGGSACRSASRMFFGNHPALTDWNLGFRVVLDTGSR